MNQRKLEDMIKSITYREREYNPNKPNHFQYRKGR